MNLVKLVITNIKNYGIFQTLILIAYETIYSLHIQYNKHIFLMRALVINIFFQKKIKYTIVPTVQRRYIF